MHELFDQAELQLDSVKESLRNRQTERTLDSLEELEETYEVLRAEVERTQKLSQMENELFTSPKSLDETLDHITAIIKHEFEFSRFDIILTDHELERVMRRYSKGDYSEKDIERLNKYGALETTKNYCLTHKKPWIVNDIKGQDPLWRLSLELDVWVHGTFPLYHHKRDGAEELVGYLHGGRTKQDFLSGKIFTESDVREMIRLGRAVINAIKEAKLSYFEHGVMKIQNVIGSTRMEMTQVPGHPDQAETKSQMDRVMDTIIETLQASMGGILVNDRDTIKSVCFRNDKKESIDPEKIDFTSDAYKGRVSRALYEGISTIENQVIAAGEKMDLTVEGMENAFHTLLAVPLIQAYSEDGVVRKNVIGVIVLLNKKDDRGRVIKTDFPGNEGGFSTLDKQIVESISPHIETIISNTRSHADLQRMSLTDGLTGLANHTHFMQNLLTLEFKRSQRYGTPLSMMLMDIDHFKVFNDIFGHQVGDLVLRETAKILKDNTRVVDHIARYGGEEFAVLLHNTSLEDALKYCDKIRKKISQGDYIGKIRDKCLFSISDARRRFRAIMDMDDERIRDAKKAIMQKHFDLDIREVLELIESDRHEDALEMIFDSFKVTLSIGMAYYPDPRISSQKDLLTTADMLLLQAKEHGRDRVESVEIT